MSEPRGIRICPDPEALWIAEQATVLMARAAKGETPKRPGRPRKSAVAQPIAESQP